MLKLRIELLVVDLYIIKKVFVIIPEEMKNIFTFHFVVVPEEMKNMFTFHSGKSLFLYFRNLLNH